METERDINTVSQRNIIQIAGIKSLQEAKMLIDCGVSLLGFPIGLPDKANEDITIQEAAKIIASFKIESRSVAITYLDTFSDILNLCNELNTKNVQIHGNIAKDELKKLKKSTDLKICKSLIVKNSNYTDIQKQIKVFSPLVDSFITDSYDAKTKRCGATGKTHDWNISRKIVQLSPRPVILAGGLNSNNVEKAILQVKPFGVDAHTGVENKSGDKDKTLLIAFTANAKNSFLKIKNGSQGN